MRSMFRLLPIIALSTSLLACNNKGKQGGTAPCDTDYVLRSSTKSCVLKTVDEFDTCASQGGVDVNQAHQIAGRLGLKFYGPDMGLTQDARQKGKLFTSIYPDQCSNLQKVWGCYQTATRSADPSTEPLCQ